MIVEQYDESLFISRFEDYKRVETPNNPNGNFTYKGLRALFEYLDEAGDEENPLYLDVIALCCEYAEYKSITELYNDDAALFEDLNELLPEYDEDNEEELNFIEWAYKEYPDDVRECITNNTPLIELGEDLNDGFIIGEY